MISATIVADSINPAGSRITTWLLTYPRFIHSEFMTHRVFSRNAASSRAIPIEKMIEAVAQSPALPERWGRKGKGMQDGGVMDKVESSLIRKHVLAGRDEMIERVYALDDMEVAKQIANRYIEPWMHMTVLATATDHRNFFALRAHPDAQPEFQVLAYRMLDKYQTSVPDPIDWGEWHLPGLSDGDLKHLPTDVSLKLCTARAARASYIKFDEELTIEKAIVLHDTKLVTSGHWSPFEHCAQASETIHYPWSNFDNPNRRACNEYITGISHWMQYRKMFADENRTNVDLAEILKTKPDWVTSS